MTTPTDTAELVQAPALTFARTIDRSLVHRAAVSEVLVTDLVQTGPESFLAGAQLPIGHPYFSDHLHKPVFFDHLLLLEAARQAGVAASHRQLGIGRDTAFLVSSWAIEIDDLTPLEAGDQPGELELDGVVTPVLARNGRMRGVDSAVSLRMNGATVGRTRINVGTAKNRDYGKLRFLQRRSVPPLTVDLLDTLRSRPADAEQVGRGNDTNVVLGEPLHLDDTVSAQVEPLFTNKSLFDHTYDHIPAMVMSEAARQLAHLAGVPTQNTVVGCDAVFTRYAELDSPLVATARLESGLQTSRQNCSVTFSQDEAEVGRISLTFSSPHRITDPKAV